MMQATINRLEKHIRAQERLSAQLLRLLGKQIPYMAEELITIAKDWETNVSAPIAPAPSVPGDEVDRDFADERVVPVATDPLAAERVKEVSDVLVDYLKKTSINDLEPGFLINHLQGLVTPPVQPPSVPVIDKLAEPLALVTSVVDKIPKFVVATIPRLPAGVINEPMRPYADNRLSGFYRLSDDQMVTFYGVLPDWELLFTPATNSLYYRDAETHWTTVTPEMVSEHVVGEALLVLLKNCIK